MERIPASLAAVDVIFAALELSSLSLNLINP
jgi:hypothetical protein